MLQRSFYFCVFTFILISLSACDDGDIIVTDFNFDADTSLEACRSDAVIDTAENQIPPIEVFYTINKDPDESISINIKNSSFNGKYNGLASTDTVKLPVNNSNEIIYRTYNGKVGNDYFCQPVPPSQPRVDEEYVSTNGGEVVLITVITDQDDDDGIPPEDESENGNPTDFNYDTDGDGIPNFLDTDDDNDNVPTAVEINLSDAPLNEDGYPDSDQDGVPNYLDPDDDGDGVPTRYEDLNAFDAGSSEEEAELNPLDDQNEEGVPNYLNPNATESLEVDYYRDNTISRTFRTRVIGRNITLKNTATDEEITVENLNFGYLKVNSSSEVLSMDSTN